MNTATPVAPLKARPKEEFPALGEKKKRKRQSFKGIDLGGDSNPNKNVDSFTLDDVDANRQVESDVDFGSFLDNLE